MNRVRLSIGELGSVVTGRTPPTSQPELFGDAYPFITPTDIDGQERRVIAARMISEAGRASMARILVPSGSVAYVCIASIGKVCMVDRPSFTNQQINTVIVDRRRFDPAFVYYALREATPRIKAIASGAATPIINKSAFSDFSIQVPELAAQRRLAKVLSAYDDLIENNTRRIAILEEMASRIYEEWFVRFRFPGHEGVRVVESELGMVPDGWRVVEVKEIVRRLPTGTVYKQAEVEETGPIPVIDQSTAELLGFHSNEPAHRATPRAPIVIFGDHTCKMQLMVVPFSLGPNTVPFVAQGLPVHYAYALVRGLVSTQEYKRHWSDLMKKKVVVAGQELTEKYATHVQPMSELLESLRGASRNLRATRDLLLPKLIAGELNVSALPEPQALAA